MRIIETKNFQKIASTRGWDSDEVARLKQIVLNTLADGQLHTPQEIHMICNTPPKGPGSVFRLTAINTILSHLIADGLADKTYRGMGWKYFLVQPKTASRNDSGRVELGGHEYTITSDGERHEVDPFNRLSHKDQIMNRLYQPYQPPKKPKPENSAQELRP